VRALNSGLPGERRLRVLLGDPPIDWAAVHKRSDFPGRFDDFPTELIRREALAKGRRALIIYGGMHLQRHAHALNLRAWSRDRRSPGARRSRLRVFDLDEHSHRFTGGASQRFILAKSQFGDPAGHFVGSAGFYCLLSFSRL